MNIILHNLDASGTLHVVGPNVVVDMLDGGQAQVALSLVFSDGTVFTSTGGATSPSSTLLPPGRYSCGLNISAYNHGAFGDTYNSTVSINGVVVATAAGAIPAGTDHDVDNNGFFIQS